VNKKTFIQARRRVKYAFSGNSLSKKPVPKNLPPRRWTGGGEVFGCSVVFYFHTDGAESGAYSAF
jgi:hypothetical protein